MSLTKERLGMESEITLLKKERTSEQLKVEMSTIEIREEISPLLEPLEVDIEKAETAFGVLRAAINRIREIDARIKKIERMM